ncbi:MAG: DNA polymerase III subunit chi [Proteobacteria bacterium]|nr:DNA polymerase III subunit chi [Pseudomonadota bacterium]MDA1350906.1 DNA polymerase III subunit chi [Pseudomonadota bacterium]
MTKVTFYKLLGDQSLALALVCQLVQKSLKANQQVLCLVPDSLVAQQLDEKLWAFNGASFLPHAQGVDQTPVAISCGLEPGEHHQVLINFQPQIPTWFSRFDRVIEIIYQQPDYEQAKRDNFRFYKERGYQLDFHDLSERFKA